MTRDDAIAVTDTLLTVSARIDESLQEMMRSGCTGSQLNEYRRLAGRIMGNIYLHMLRPVFAEHPHLEPVSGDRVESPLSRETCDRVVSALEEVVAALDRVRQMFGARSLENEFAEGAEGVLEAVADARQFIERSGADRL